MLCGGTPAMAANVRNADSHKSSLRHTFAVHAAATSHRHAVHEGLQPLGWDQLPGVSPVSPLSAPRFARGRLRRAVLDVEGVAGGELRRVGRVLPQPRLEPLDPLLQGRDDGVDRRLRGGGDLVPELRGDRWRLAHAAGITSRSLGASTYRRERLPCKKFLPTRYQHGKGHPIADRHRRPVSSSTADFRLLFDESRKPSKSGRTPLATFCVRLLRERRKGRKR
jgi:hypothetical protein